MRLRATLFTFAVTSFACGGAPAPVTPETPAGGASATPTAAAAPVEEIPVTPELPGPEAPTDAEKAEVAGPCSPLLTAMIEGEAAALRALDDGFRDGTADADEAALKLALERVTKSRQGLGAAEHQRCLALFEKQQRRKQFEHEPAEGEARMVVDSCIKRVEAVYGKQTMAFGDGGPGLAQGPFCPDEFPVPQKLSQLPYQSTKDDWEATAFRCLQFGLRVKQYVQFEYVSPRGSSEFQCIARFLPRKGGAPIEVVRGGKQGSEGQLLLDSKTTVRRMAPRG
ncbi:MAG: hypothetical protein FJ096_11540 [Deltaproteobacteria bacterium]|nr:hypothetical protein [Deltaproteobacteria bacterium]